MRIRIFIAVLTLAGAAFSQTPPVEPGVSHELAKWRAARYSDVRYKLNLTLEKMSPVLKGTMEIRVKVGARTLLSASPENEEVSPIILDWRKIRGSESLSTISNISINGAPIGERTLLSASPNSKALPPSPNVADAPQTPPADRSVRAPIEANEHLIFRDGVVAGENVIKLDFTSPILTSGSAITRYVDKEDGSEYIYSLFVPSDASTAFPVFDQPDLKARFDTTFSGPFVGRDGWRVISNNTAMLNLPIDGPGGPTFQFIQAQPISTYVFAFAAGPFERVSEPGTIVTGALGPAKGPPGPSSKTPVTIVPGSDTSNTATNVFVRKSQAAKFKPHAAEVFRLNREGIKFLESYFDYKFPFPKYDIVLIPEFPFGGMEHAGATFLRESSVIFPQEPTKNDYISRANLIFHEAAHQWFGDTVTMKWFDDLWLKEGFAEFMAYKTLEKVMPEYNAWKVFYERNKQAAYLTDSTKGTTPIYQEIANLSAAKSAYGNIVYRKAPSFLKQAEFYLGHDKFQTAVRAFLKKHEYANAGWEDLVDEFEATSGKELDGWGLHWVKAPGLGVVRLTPKPGSTSGYQILSESTQNYSVPDQRVQFLVIDANKTRKIEERYLCSYTVLGCGSDLPSQTQNAVIPNYQDYGYGIFLLDDKSRDYVLKNIGREKDDFLRTMMWGSLWDSVREGELDPKEYVELVIKNLKLETDESTVQTLLGRVSTAMRYYLEEPPALAGGTTLVPKPPSAGSRRVPSNSPAYAGGSDLQARVENLLIDRMQNASTPGQRITYYRAFLNIASSENARRIMKSILKGSVSKRAEPGTTVTGALKSSQNTSSAGAKTPVTNVPGSAPTPTLAGSTKDRFDIVGKLIILGDPEAPKLLADLENTEKSDDAKRYAYAAKAGFATTENKAKFWTDFVSNKDISESWIEAAFGPFNNIRHNELTLPYLEKALAELPNLKRSRKIFFVNGWLGAFIGGQKSEAALAIVNKFLADNPNLDKDLRLKILENVDLIERAVRIRGKYGR